MPNETWYTAKAKQWERHKAAAKAMRREPTLAEGQLWQRLRKREFGHPFRRQHAIDRFIVDFCCLQAKLIVEVDGPIHDGNQARDAARDERLEQFGFKVLRFRNDEVLTRLDDLMTRIGDALADRR